jgi:signal transduction histidine kinase
VTQSLRGRLTSPVVAWVLLCLSLAMFAGFGALFYSPLTPQSFYANSGAFTAFWAFPLASVPIIGALLAIRRPTNALGWVSLWAGVAIGAGLLGAIGGSLLTNSHQAFGRYVLLLSAIFNTSTSPALGVLLVILLLFPDGQLPSRRWRWVMRALLAVMAFGLVISVVNPTPGYLDANGGNDISPLAIRGSADVINGMAIPYNIALYAIGVAAVVSVFLRLRGADSERRHQIRWVAYAGGVSFSIYALTSLTPNTPSGALLALLLLAVVIAGVAVPVAIGIAVLKYRLYDIDIVISRTLVYGSLAVFITAVYVGIAVGIGALIGGGGKPNLGLSILATAIVAVGFQPVRERMQRLANRLVYGKRATPYEVLSQFSERVAESYATDDVMPRMARVLAEGTGAQRADVWLRTGSVWRDAAVWPVDAAAFAHMPAEDGNLPSSSGGERVVAVRHQGELLGALSVTKRAGESLTPVEESLLSHLAHQAGLVVKNVGLTADLQMRLDELRASRQRLVGAQDQERRRLERNLHDGAQQHLVALKVKLGLAEMLLDRDPVKAQTTLVQLKADADEALETLRDLARGIYPPLLADKGLTAALESQARKATVEVTVNGDGIGRYSQEVEAAVYFSVLEAMQNVQKYAGATKVVVRLHEKADRLAFAVEDDGCGFDIATVSRGSGLTNMEDRLDALGGSLQVVSSIGRGTSLQGWLAISAQEAMAPAPSG